MKGARCLLIVLVLYPLINGAGFAVRFELEQIPLRSVAVAIFAYMEANNGQVPSNLEPLADYIDVAKLLKATPGTSTRFIEQYTLFPSKPKMSLPMQGDVQLILLETEPTRGVRAAIWLSKEGRPDVGLLLENELEKATGSNLDLQNLQPMGGVVPETSAKVLAAAANRGMTEYEARVLALAREGKLEPDPPYSPKIHGPLPERETSPPATIESATPNPKPSAAETSLPGAKKESPASFPFVPVTIVTVIIAGVSVFLLRRKRL